MGCSMKELREWKMTQFSRDQERSLWGGEIRAESSRLKEISTHRTGDGRQAESTARTEAREEGSPTPGGLDPVTEVYQCGWNSFGGREIGRGQTVVSCDPRLTVRTKSKVQWEAIRVSGREVTHYLWLYRNIFLKHFKHEKSYNEHSSTAQHERI